MPNNSQVEFVQKSLKLILVAVKNIDFVKILKLIEFLVKELICTYFGLGHLLFIVSIEYINKIFNFIILTNYFQILFQIF